MRCTLAVPRTARQLRILSAGANTGVASAPAGKRAIDVVFASERDAPLSAPGFSRMIKRAATAADLGIKAHAHMLRHACGYKLANDGHDTRAIQAYLGHRNIQNTTRHTALGAPTVQGILSRLMKVAHPIMSIQGKLQWPIAFFRFWE